ncbi:MAG: ribbon-helix-helix domain-containing protein [Alphaproteobacteria bacterium]|nr:ribbon-helix-helix domain-containing protein [Alphaproteobacteria bacterium]
MSSPDGTRFHKRSVSLHGHKTSVSLENAFWRVLEEAALAQNISLSQVIRQVDENRQGALSSALRLYALRIVENRTH